MLLKKKKFYFLIIIPLVIFGVLFGIRDFLCPKTLQSVTLSQDFPDPSVLFYKNKFYAYSTRSLKRENKVVATPYAEGKSKEDYTYKGNATPNLPGWSKKSRLPQAPDVYFNGKQFIMYSTIFDREYNHYTISVGRSKTPQGPFVFGDKPDIVDKTASFNVFDPSHFVDKNGKEYLAYATDEVDATKIQLIQVDKKNNEIKGKSKTILTQFSVTNPENNGKGKLVNRVEAPQLLLAPDGTYVLIFSGNDANKKTYFTGYATSKTIDGYYTYQGALLTTALLKNKIVGPGGVSLVTGNDKHQLVLHGWIGKPGFYTSSKRVMYNAKLNWRNGHIPSITNFQQSKISDYRETVPVSERNTYTRIVSIIVLFWMLILLIMFTSTIWRPEIVKSVERRRKLQALKEKSRLGKKQEISSYEVSAIADTVTKVEEPFIKSENISFIKEGRILLEENSDVREVSIVSDKFSDKGSVSVSEELVMIDRFLSVSVSEESVIVSHSLSNSVSEESVIISHSLSDSVSEELGIVSYFLSDSESEIKRKKSEFLSESVILQNESERVAQVEEEAYSKVGLESFNLIANDIMERLQKGSEEIRNQQKLEKNDSDSTEIK